MAQFQQPSTYTTPVDPSTPVDSPEYIKQRVNRYVQVTNPAFKSSQRSLRSNLASRGLLDSGIAGGEFAGLEQNRTADISNVATALSEQQAQQAEQERIRQMMRGWQVADMDKQRGWSEEDAARMESLQQQAQQAQLWGTIAQGAGTVIGGVYGGPMGAAAGGAAGKALTSGMGGDTQSEIDALGKRSYMNYPTNTYGTSLRY